MASATKWRACWLTCCSRADRHRRRAPRRARATRAPCRSSTTSWGRPRPPACCPPRSRRCATRRGIEREQVVDALAADFGITGAAGRKALERNYHQLETGKLLGSKLKRSLMESLARIFQIDVRDLLAGARPTSDAQLPVAVPGMGRGGGHATSTRSALAEELLPDPEVERVERLFHGGPDD